VALSQKINFLPVETFRRDELFLLPHEFLILSVRDMRQGSRPHLLIVDRVAASEVRGMTIAESRAQRRQWQVQLHESGRVALVAADAKPAPGSKLFVASGLRVSLSEPGREGVGAAPPTRQEVEYQLAIGNARILRAVIGNPRLLDSAGISSRQSMFDETMRAWGRAKVAVANGHAGVQDARLDALRTHAQLELAYASQLASQAGFFEWARSQGLMGSF
jgi:hypothetical protein